MKTVNMLLPRIVSLAALVFVAANAGATDTAIERVAVGTCANCHGPEGRSIAPQFPVLAGQHANYLVAQMHAFKEQTRADPDAIGYMWGMAAPLSDSEIAALADYYSLQHASAGSRDKPALIEHGRDIYRNGLASEGIPACVSCHGAQALGTEMYPRLAGQHAQYLLKQLQSFQRNLRDVAVMHGVAAGLKVDEMKAVAAYLQSLGGG